jgi:hypothetical protein
MWYQCTKLYVLHFKKAILLILKCLSVADSQMQTKATVLSHPEEIREIFKMMEMMISIAKSWHSVSRE